MPRPVYLSGVVYYCKDCEKIVDADQVGRKYVFRCRVCKTKNVAFGTDKSIRSYFHVYDEAPPAPPAPAASTPVPPVTPVTPVAPVTPAPVAQ